MSKNVFDIESYTPKREDKLFFDANIWLYLFSPLGNYKRQVIKKYDRFLKKAIQVKASLFISSLVLSEFFNAYVKMEFNILKEKSPRKYKDFKKNFRNTREYVDLVNQIKTTMDSRILKISERINDEFDKIDLEKVFNGIEKTGFNDRYYQELALGRGMKIVTHDHDFIKTGKEVIITANSKVLKGG